MFEKKEIKIAGRSVTVLIEKEFLVDGQLSNRQPCFVVGLSSHYHDKFSEKFHSFYKLVLIDLYWTDEQFSSAYINTLEMDLLAEHIEQARKQLQDQLGDAYQKIFVLAHSAYGFIGLSYALNYPNSIMGLINVASPLIFNNELSVKWQEEYIDANFGDPRVGGPTARWHAYYDKKALLAEKKPDQSKQYFLSSYMSKGPLFFNNPDLWQNREGRAEKMWNPWQIPVFDRKTNRVILETRDINMSMMSRYIELLKNAESYSIIRKIQVPVLWVISLGDLRVSLYQLEDRGIRNFLGNVEFFHPANTSHWPMLPMDADTTEFDDKLIDWGGKILEFHHHEGPGLMSKMSRL